jgi:hypothetical protein
VGGASGGLLPQCGYMPPLKFALRTDRERDPVEAESFPRSLYEQST